MRTLVVGLFIASAVITLPAQQQRKPADKMEAGGKAVHLGESRTRYWLERSQEVEQIVRANSTTLDALTESALKIRLAQIWIKADPAHAQALLGEGVGSLSTVSDAESTEQLTRRFDMVANLIEDVGRLSTSAMMRLQGTMETIAQKLDTSRDPKRTAQLADTLATASLNCLQANPDPARALRFAEMSLQAGGSKMTGELVASISIVDRERSQQLGSEILTYLRRSSNPALLKGLFDSVVLGNALTNTDLRSATMAMMADAAITAGDNNGNQACVYSDALASALTQYDPGTRARLESVIDRCANGSPSTTVGRLISTNNLKTVDDILAFAENQPDVRVRAPLKFDAAELAEAHGDAERALKILDEMDEQERKQNTEKWTNDRANFAVEAGVNAVRSKDFDRLYDLIYRVPDETKLWVELTLLERLNRSHDSSAATDLLRLATKALGDTDPDRVAVFSMLLNDTAALSPEMLPQLWPEVVNRLDDWIGNAERTQSRKLRTVHALYDNLRSEPLSPDTLGGDGAVPLAALDTMTHQTVRLSFGLGILRGAVNSYVSSFQKSAPAFQTPKAHQVKR